MLVRAKSSSQSRCLLPSVTVAILVDIDINLYVVHKYQKKVLVNDFIHEGNTIIRKNILIAGYLSWVIRTQTSDTGRHTLKGMVEMNGLLLY